MGGAIRFIRLVAVVAIALLLHPAPHLKHTERIVQPAKAPAKVANSQPVQKPATVIEAAAPAPAPTPMPVTPTYSKSCAAYAPTVAQYKWNVTVAMAIMRAESGCNPYAISPARLNYDHISDYGLFQIHGQRILNPDENIATAYHKYQSQGWNAWNAYKSGSYRRYL